VSDPVLKKPKWSGLGVRFGSAVGLVLLCLAPFYFGGWLWAALAGLFGGRMLYEWVRMSDPSPNVLSYVAPMLGLAAGIIYAVQGFLSFTILTVLVAAAAVYGLHYVRGKSDRLARPGWAVLGVFYIVVPTLLIIAMRGNAVGFDTVGFQRLLFIIACVVGADVGAYFGGSILGGPKLAPTLSPNKTWSGFFSGQFCAIVLGGLVGLGVGIGWLSGAILALPIALLSVLGDLFESGVKRKLGVKDTGDLMPGHGGLLDRLDSLMAAVVGAALVLAIFPAIWPG